MARKKNPKELIELLLRQQRENRQGPAAGREPDPLEGIEWRGLPEGLRDRVYRPLESREALVELLTSVGKEAKESPAPSELASEGPLAAEELELPRRPPWPRRLRDWFFDFFAILNKTYEVRVATVLAFAAGAAFFACLSYLLGNARGQASIQLLEHRGPAEELRIAPPVGSGPRDVREVRPPAAAPTGGEIAGKPQARKDAPPPIPHAPGPVYSIRVTTGTSREAAAKVCTDLRARGLEADEPRFFSEGRGWVVILGRWATKRIAQERLAALQGVFDDMVSAKVIHNQGDQTVLPTTN